MLLGAVASIQKDSLDVVFDQELGSAKNNSIQQSKKIQFDKMYLILKGNGKFSRKEIMI